MSEEEKYTIEMTREEIDALIQYCQRGTPRLDKPYSEYERATVIVTKLMERLGKIRDRCL